MQFVIKLAVKILISKKFSFFSKTATCYTRSKSHVFRSKRFLAKNIQHPRPPT